MKEKVSACMKKMLLIIALLLSISYVQAAISAADLTPDVVAATMSALPKSERVAYARSVLDAIATLPISDEEKTEMLITITRVLISTGATTDVLAEIFNAMPIQYLPAVADMLARADFAQSTNGMTDEQYNNLCEKIVRSASEYIESSGTDSPAVRIGILAATFTQGSSNPEATQARVLAAVPEAVQAAAATYVNAVVGGNMDVIAAAAGVNTVEETPTEDPDADRIVQRDAETDYLTPEAPTADDTAPEGREGETTTVPDVKVPLLARYADDVLSLTIDTAISTMYDWETGSSLGNTLPTMPFGTLEQVFGVDEEVPAGGSLRPSPSPTYGNQYL